jgi:hypothetical protein
MWGTTFARLPSISAGRARRWAAPPVLAIDGHRAAPRALDILQRLDMEGAAIITGEVTPQPLPGGLSRAQPG